MPRPQIPAVDQAARKAHFISLVQRMQPKSSNAVAAACGIRAQTVRMYLSQAVPKYPSESVLARLEAAYLHDLESREAVTAAAAEKATRAREAFQREMAA